MEPAEIWKSLDWIDSRYEVSNLGRVRSWARRGTARTIAIAPKILAPSRSRYLVLQIKTKFIHIHYAVARTFLGQRPDGFYINHIDGNKHNNRVENLEYVTPKQNADHAMACGLGLKGERVGTSKLSTEMVLEIKQRNASAQALASRFGVTKKHVKAIWRGDSWKHVQC